MGKLFFLRRRFLPSQIKEFTAEEPDTAGIIFQDALDILPIADIGKNLDFSAVRRDIIFALQCIQRLKIKGSLLDKSRNALYRLFIRIDIKPATYGVYSCFPPVENIQAFRGKIHIDQRRDIETSGKNGSMRIGRTLSRHKGQYLCFIQIDGFAGGQVICQNNDSFGAFQALFSLSGEFSDDPFGDIQHIDRPCLHVFVIHLGKGAGKKLRRYKNGVFRRQFFFFDQTLDAFEVVQILQHHLMDLENLGVFFTDLCDGILIKPLQLLLRQHKSRLQSFEFPIRIGNNLFFRCAFFLSEGEDFPQNRAPGYHASTKRFHSFPRLFKEFHDDISRIDRRRFRIDNFFARFRIADDERRLQSVAGLSDFFKVSHKKQIACLNLISRLHLDRKTLALEVDRIQTDVDQ